MWLKARLPSNPKILLASYSNTFSYMQEKAEMQFAVLMCNFCI